MPRRGRPPTHQDRRGPPTRTHCQRGHAFAPENTILLLDKSRLPAIAYQRKCRACHLARQRRYRERHGLTQRIA